MAQVLFRSLQPSLSHYLLVTETALFCELVDRLEMHCATQKAKEPRLIVSLSGSERCWQRADRTMFAFDPTRILRKALGYMAFSSS